MEQEFEEVDDFTFLPGTASLVDEVDKRILVVLQDGRKLWGVLRSFDQYGWLNPSSLEASLRHYLIYPVPIEVNLVLEHTIERIYVGREFAEKRLGLFLVRGDNIVLLGPVDENREELCVQGLTQVTVGEIEAARKAKRLERNAKQKMNQDLWS